MYEHLENIKQLYGDNIYVQIPNDIFKKLSLSIKDKKGSTNIQQSSFAYTYIVVVAILYKYAHFVDVSNNTYIQNSDIKEMLGYSKTTKSIDSIIKKGGILDEINLTTTTKLYPVVFSNNYDEKINNIAIREFKTVDDFRKDDHMYKSLKSIVKNRNYEIKEPNFLFSYNDENGTLYDYSNTHTVTLDEILTFLRDDLLDNIDFSMYCFLKSKCNGCKNNSKSISLSLIVSQLGISKDAFYSHLNKIKGKGYFDVEHKGWKSSANDKLESNVYTFNNVLNINQK